MMSTAVHESEDAREDKTDLSKKTGCNAIGQLKQPAAGHAQSPVTAVQKL